MARVAGERKNRGKTGGGRPGRKTRVSRFGGARISVEGQEGSKSLLLFLTRAHTQGHRTRNWTHTQGCVTSALAHAPRRRLRRLFPAFPFTACGGRWGEAERAPGMEPRGQRDEGARTRVSRGNHQGASVPGKHTRVPQESGWSVAGSGKKWEMTHQDSPLLWWGTVYIRASSPKPTIPTQPPS